MEPTRMFVFIRFEPKVSEYIEEHVDQISKMQSLVSYVPKNEVCCRYTCSCTNLSYKPLSLHENFTEAVAEIRRVAAQGATLVILPGNHLTSWEPDHPDFVTRCWEALDYIPRYQALARELHVRIVLGTTVVPSDTASSNSEGTELDFKHYSIAATSGALTTRRQGQYTI
ncbi:hypothetical protein RRF57_000787 [Xylaria bambusicola]|uniref:CN hydrolase domain-containing protein n=1 Tax=Xylaria bambusicola TaxID=326684 RepID=A0AAN7Z5S6_9PEZI